MTIVFSHRMRYARNPTVPVRLCVVPSLIAALIAAGCGGGHHQKVEPGVYETSTVATFAAGGPLVPNGDLVSDSIGELYGTAASNTTARPNSVFKINRSTGAIAGLNVPVPGSEVSNVMVDRELNLFGVWDEGDIFELCEIRVGTTPREVRASITKYDKPYLVNPRVRCILDNSGNLFGTLVSDYNSEAPWSYNQVFEVSKDANGILAPPTLASFSPGNSKLGLGQNIVVDSHGNVFGTTASRASYSDSPPVWGTVWEIVKGSGTAKTLAEFDNSANAKVEDHIAIDGAGNLYGVTNGSIDGAPQNHSIVYEIPYIGNGYGQMVTLGTLPGFPLQGTISDLVIDRNGNLYGIRSADTPGGQVHVYKVFKDTRQVTDLAALEAGSNPEGSLRVDGSGNVFVTIHDQTSSEPQAIFEIVKGSGIATPLISLGSNPRNSERNFLMDSDGHLFGIATDDVASGSAHVVELSPVSRSVK